jgi:hypothetical protein
MEMDHGAQGLKIYTELADNMKNTLSEHGNCRNIQSVTGDLQIAFDLHTSNHNTQCSPGIGAALTSATAACALDTPG